MGSSKIVKSDLVRLPLELFEEVVEYLDPTDAVICSSVSRSWRSAFNVDSFWKKWCRLENFDPDLVNLNNTEENNSLEPLCYWHRVYTWYKTLELYWTNKRYTTFTLDGSESPVYCLDSDGLTAVSGHLNSDVSIWSVQPVRKLATVQGLLPNHPVISVKTTSKFIVITQKKLLQVLQLDELDDSYSLVDVKSFELGERNVEQYENVNKYGAEFSAWYLACLRANGEPSISTCYALSDGLLCASGCTFGIIRVWSLPRGEVELIDVKLHITQLLAHKGQIYLVGQDTCTILLLLRGSKEVLAVLSVPGKKTIVVGGGLVMALPAPGDISLKRIWAWKLGEFTKPLGTTTINAGHFSAVVAHPHFVVYSEGSIIKVWDPFTKRTFTSFSTGTVSGFIRAGTGSKFIVFTDGNIIVWDWKTGSRLYTIHTCRRWSGDYRNLLWVSPSMIIAGGPEQQIEMIIFQ